MRTREGEIVWMLDEAVLEADDQGVPVWHGVLYDITERKHAEGELQRALSQQAVVARLGERALQNGDPEALMRAAAALIGEVDGRPQRLHLGARPRRSPPQPPRRARGPAWSAPAAASPPPSTPTPAPRSTRARTRSSPTGRPRSRFTMPPVLRAFGAASSLAVMIDGKDHPFGVLDVHATEPRPLQPQGRSLRAGRRQRAGRRDRAPRRRPGAAPPGPARPADRAAQPAQLRRRARRRAQARRPSPARRSGSSSSTSTTSS